MGTIPQGVPLSDFKELEELVSEDLALIEPIIDEMLAEAARAKPGSGTTILVARNLQCHGIGLELNAGYLEIAKRRLAQTVMEFSQ